MTIKLALGSNAARVTAIVVTLLMLSTCAGPMQSVHQVFYQANGATGGTAPVDFTAWASGTEVIVKGNTGTLTNGDLVFAGWNTKPDGSGDSYPAGSILVIANASVTLYAQWKARSASTDLQINEVASSWGPGTPVAIELWNPTGQTLELSNYRLRTRARTADSSATDVGLVTFALPSLSLPPDSYVILRSGLSPDFVSGGSTVYLLQAASPSAVVPWYSGTADAVELLRADQTVDFVRWGTSPEKPTTAAFGFSGSAPALGSSGASLARDRQGQFTPSPSDWTNRLWNTLGGPNDVTSDTDTDGDGLPDSAEVAGGTLAGLPLADWGARPDRVDLFIHVDYLNKAGAPAAALPQKAALQKVVDRFAAHNIAVHFDVGTRFSATYSPGDFNLDNRSHELPWSDSLSIGVHANTANANELKARSMTLAKNRSFFYLVFGNSQDYATDVANNRGGSGGLAYVWGNVSVVTLGTWELTGPLGADELINDQAATILHELGHNLGLRHGGFEDLNYKPNYVSMMNYLYAYSGIPSATTVAARYYDQYRDTSNGNPALQGTNSPMYLDDATSTSYLVDFSDGTSAPLDENAITETLGMGRTGYPGIDFNNDGVISASPAIINLLQLLNAGVNHAPSTLTDYDDWSHLDAVFQHSYSGLYGDSWRGLPEVPWAPPPTVYELLTRGAWEVSADSGLRR